MGEIIVPIVRVRIATAFHSIVFGQREWEQMGGWREWVRTCGIPIREMRLERGEMTALELASMGEFGG